MKFHDQLLPHFSKMITFPTDNGPKDFWLSSIRLDGFGWVMDVCGNTEEEANDNADYVCAKLNKE